MTADSSFSYIDASVSEKEGLPYPERGFKLLLNGLECQMKQDYIGTGHHFRSVLITTKYNTKLTCKHCPRDRELLPLSSRCKTQGGRGDKMSYKQMIRRSAFTRVCSFTEYEFRNNIDRNLKRKTHTHTHTHTITSCPCSVPVMIGIFCSDPASTSNLLRHLSRSQPRTSLHKSYSYPDTEIIEPNVCLCSSDVAKRKERKLNQLPWLLLIRKPFSIAWEARLL